MVDVFLCPDGKIGSRRGRFHGFGVSGKKKIRRVVVCVFFFFLCAVSERLTDGVSLKVLFLQSVCVG